jgi:hypothetical protein
MAELVSGTVLAAVFGIVAAGGAALLVALYRVSGRPLPRGDGKQGD